MHNDFLKSLKRHPNLGDVKIEKYVPLQIH